MKVVRWFAFWSALGLVFSSQLYFADQRLSPQAASWPSALRANFFDWWLWGLVYLAVVQLVRLKPLDHHQWRRHAPVHVAFGLQLALAHLALAVWVQWGARALAGEPYPFTSKFVDNFLLYFLWNVVIYLAILGVVVTREQRRALAARDMRQAQLEARLAEARAQALQLQLQPHFLFNALNATAELVHEDPEAAERMIGGIAGLLRTTLSAGRQPDLPLREELAIADGYLGIERVRFADRLSVEVMVPPDLLEARVPALLLLPLVENAVRHGIGRRDGRGTIAIRARRRELVLELEVWDHGPSTAPEAVAAGQGIGLANTRERLAQLYGGAQRVELLAQDGGTLVRVSLPCRTAAAA